MRPIDCRGVGGQTIRSHKETEKEQQTSSAEEEEKKERGRRSLIDVCESRK